MTFDVENREKVTVTVTAPVFNEIDNLESLVSRIDAVLASIDGVGEILLVDDGSTDGGFAAIQRLRLAYPRLRALRFDRNHGQSAAMAAGVAEARGEIVVTIDADLQNDPADIPMLVRTLLEGHFDAVVGWRQQRHDSWLRRASSRFSNWLRNLVTAESIHDTGCSLKAFRREAIRQVPWFEGMHRFLPTLIRYAGGRVAEVPVTHHPRAKGVSKYGVLNRAGRAFLDLLAVRWMRWRWLRFRVVERV